MANEVNRRNFADEEEHRDGKKNEHQIDNTMDDNSGYLIRFQGGKCKRNERTGRKREENEGERRKGSGYSRCQRESWIN